MHDVSVLPRQPTRARAAGVRQQALSRTMLLFICGSCSTGMASARPNLGGIVAHVCIAHVCIAHARRGPGGGGWGLAVAPAKTAAASPARESSARTLNVPEASSVRTIAR